jgi:phage gp36-like protein
LLLRSTDDKTLIPLAYSAAKDIPDETKRAQALLDTIKEIDYLSHPNPTV